MAGGTACYIDIYIIIANCSQDDGVAKKDYSGEEIFRGIFFLQGDVVNHLESLHADLNKLKATQKANPESIEYFESFVNEIVTQINLLDPDYFDSFKSQLESNNYYSIELALSNGTRMIKAAGLKSKELSGVFRLMLEIENKKVDFESDHIKQLDFNNQEDIAKLKSILKNDYSIDLDEEEYSVACSLAIAICVVYAAVAFISIAAVSHTAAVAVQAVAVVAYYLLVEVWGMNTSGNEIATNELILEIVTVF